MPIGFLSLVLRHLVRPNIVASKFITPKCVVRILPSSPFLFALIVLSNGCSPSNRASLEFPGIVETQEVRLSSKVGGRVEKVLVKEGEHVAKDQPLVEFDRVELEAKRAQLIALQDAAQAKLDLMCNGPLPEQIAAAKSTTEAVEAKLTRLVAGWRSEEVEMAKHDVDIWNAEYEKAKAEYERLAPLKATNSVSLTDLEAARAAMLKSQSQARSMTNRFDMLVKGNRVEDIDEARAELARVRADYDLIKRGTREEEIRGAKAQLAEVVARIRELDTLLNECTLVAPEACLIEVVSVRHGDSAAPNQPVLRVLYENDLWVKAYVPETELSNIRLNQSVQVRHDGSKRDYPGTVIHIANISEFTPRNVQSPEERHHQVFAIKVQINDADGVFKSGMAARVTAPRSLTPE